MTDKCAVCGADVEPGEECTSLECLAASDCTCPFCDERFAGLDDEEDEP